MLHARTANIQCDRYCSTFLEFVIQLNKGYASTVPCVLYQIPQWKDKKEMTVMTWDEMGTQQAESNLAADHEMSQVLNLTVNGNCLL